jgi:hypothetical protein
VTERIPRIETIRNRNTKRQDRISHFKAAVGKQPEEEAKEIGTDDFLSVDLPP